MQGRLYAIRHLNVKAGLGNPLDGKLRLKQILRALKKYRGPKNKKCAVTRAMLLMVHELLSKSSQAWGDDEVVLWAAIITAFHLFARSCEYCAKGGTFDLDRVFRRFSVAFYKDGKRIYSNFAEADQVRVTFGKTKAGGGETRVLHALNHVLCPVRALAQMYQRIPTIKAEAALFSWAPTSLRKGPGVSYEDVSLLLKQAAVALGVDPKKVGTHSLRRGGATAYLMAGASYNDCKMYGRWRSDCVREYVECYDDMMLSAGHRVVAGNVRKDLFIKQDMPERAVLRERAAREWQKIQQMYTS